MPVRLLTYTSDEPLPTGGGLPRLLAQRQRHHDLHITARILRNEWANVCLGADVSRHIDNVTGGVDIAPELTHVHLGADAITMTVRVLPGMLPSDLTAVARRLAYGLGVAGVRVQRFRDPFVRVVLLTEDPLTAVVDPVPAAASALHPLTLGMDESALPVFLELGSAAHLIVQGTTGSGKSVGLYSLLGQLAEAPDVRVTGSDPTGLLLRPWAGRWSDAPAPVLGTGDPMAHLLMLESLVREMDKRVAAISPGRDSVDLGADLPVIVCVLEEYPGLLRVVDGIDPKLGKSVRTLVGRLLAEARKAGIRLVIVAQRADAGIIGGYERAQASHRISYRVDSMDAVRMLHPDALSEDAAQHASAPPGVALASVPGQSLLRLRSPRLDYAQYWRQVTGQPAVPVPAQRVSQ
jgi:S-DNA-T family DNA segregation ATPase FtsK/SpoIIIE